MPVLADTGFVALTDADFDVPSDEWLDLEYMDWKSGGDTNFAPLASADGQLDCRGFWDKGKTDKDALWTSNATVSPTLKSYVDAVGANFGRVRVIKLEPQDRDEAIRSIHRDDNNRFNPDDEGWVVRSWLELTDNPDSYMLLMDNGPDGLPDPATEIACPAAPRRSVRGRHAAVVARRRAQRRRSPLRPHHQLRVRPEPRTLGRLEPASPGQPLTRPPASQTQTQRSPLEPALRLGAKAVLGVPKSRPWGSAWARKRQRECRNRAHEGVTGCGGRRRGRRCRP